ncbi:Tetratricopeptide repeat protein 28 (TPR repeat protein 28) (TPR repeat-containing big gene cloned at Keio) [Durusdinium trenchii]|uniref:Tetratricopeptide repeat protein 28 (TPR repeat protein 28) (TPR repeat-containing big gene cloned at Keio) n=1 Tax=Durusdinium trenchii TaxID=1381693 RepID=A0ABP0KKL9_9DINO
MAVITEIESDDELPPLVQSGSATSQKGAPAKERLTQIPRQAVPVNDESDDEDDDELPPLISSTGKVDEAPKKEVPPPAKMPEAKASPAARGLGAGNRQQIEPPVAAKADAAKAVAAKADVAKADAKEADDKVLSRDDLDDAIEVLEDGHYEDAEFLAGEARSQAASEGDAAREADALRVVTKAQIKEAESQGFDAPDSDVLEKALKAASSEAFAFEKSGQFVAKAIMQLASAEIFLAMDSHAEALPMAQQALSTLEQADASRERKGMAYRSLVDIYLAQGRHSLVAITTERVKEHILKPSTRQEARELAGALLSCAKARVAASEAVAAVEAAEQAGALFERMGDARQTALAACEEAKAYNLMKGSQIAARRTASRALALARETCDSKIEAEACLCSCMAYVNAQQGPEALKAGKQALSLAREVRDIEMIGQAIQALMQISGQEKASQIAEEELMMAKKVGDRRREANAQQKMAAAMALQDRPREAIRRGTEAMEQLRQVGDLKGEAKAAQMLVELQCQGKRMMEAKRSAKDAQRIFKEIGDPKGCVGVLQYLTSVFLEAGEQHEAIQAARDQVKVFREAGFKEEEASATLGLAEMTQQTMGPRDALRLCKDAASMFQSVGDIGGEARALAQCTQLHVALKSNSTASETAKQAEDLARRSGDAKILSTTLQACAEAYTNSERFTEALDLAKEALQLAEKAAVKDEAGRASALACLASVHLQTGHHDVNHPGIRSRPRGLKEAVKISEEALAIHRKLNDHSGEIGGVQRIFHAHLLGQDGPNALRYAREYMELAQRSVQKDNLGPALVSLCQAHFLCRNYEEAERANLEARAIFEKARSRENLEICDQIMSELKQEVERTQRPTQPMGKANTTQGAGFGYNSLLPERQVRSQGNGVPVGGFGGSESTAGADALRRGSEGGAASTARKSERSNDPSAKGFSEGLRGAFSRQSQSSQSSKPPAASPTPAPAPAPAASPAPRTTSSSFRSSAASSGGREGRSGLGERYGSSRSSYSSSYTNGGGYSNVANGHSTSSRGGYGSYSQPQRGVPAGGFGGRGVPAGGFGGAVATPASAPDERPRGATSRPGAFAGFAGRGLGRGEE